MSIMLSSPVSMSYAIVITFFVVVLLQRNDYCLVECTAKKDMDKSNKYQWHVVCTRTEESSHGEIKCHGRLQHICLKHTCKCACTLQIAAEYCIYLYLLHILILHYSLQYMSLSPCVSVQCTHSSCIHVLMHVWRVKRA